MMLKRVKPFLKSEDGAVSVDWVLLTFAILLLTIAVFPPILNSTVAVANSIVAMINSQ